MRDPSASFFTTKIGIFPYEHMTSYDSLYEPLPLDKKAFYSSINNKSVSQSDFERAHEVYRKFECANLGSYVQLYCLRYV